MIEIHGSELLKAETQLQQQRLQMGIDALCSAPTLLAVSETAMLQHPTEKRPQPAALRRLKTTAAGLPSAAASPVRREDQRFASTSEIESSKPSPSATTHCYYPPSK